MIYDKEWCIAEISGYNDGDVLRQMVVYCDYGF